MMLSDLGCVVATPAALDLLEEANVSPSSLIARHASGDWGDVGKGNAEENDLSVGEGLRILSSYRIGGDGEKVWCVSEADRSSTCLVAAGKY